MYHYALCDTLIVRLGTDNMSITKISDKGNFGIDFEFLTFGLS